MLLSALPAKISDDKNLFLSISLVFAIFLAFLGIIDELLTLGFVGLLVVIVVIAITWKYPIFAFLINIGLSYFGFFFVSRVLRQDIPLGVAVDGLHFFALFIFLIKGKLKGLETPVGIFIIVWIGFVIIQAFNPHLPSITFWLIGFRSWIGFLVPFYLLYSFLRENREGIKVVVVCWLVCGFFGALYTMHQEFFGYLPFEMNMIVSDEEKYNLLWTFGRFRKMGPFAGPTEAGIMMAINALISLGVIYSKGFRKRIKLGCSLVFIFSTMSMMYTGTRTATLIWIIGMLIFTVLTRDRILIMGCVVAFFLIGPVLIATGKGGAAVNVMLTAFDPDDPSLQVRLESQQEIREILLAAPIGYGIGRNNNDITSIQPDSTYVWLAILAGYIGLILWLIFQYIIINVGVSSLQGREDENWINLKKSILTVAIMIVIAQYPQVLFGYPTIKMMYIICLAVLSLGSKDQMTKDIVS